MKRILSLITIGFLCLSMFSIIKLWRTEAQEMAWNMNPTPLPYMHAWNRTYGGNSDSDAYCLIQTLDGGYALAGWTKSYGAGGQDAWMVKVDSSGNVEWNQTYGGPETDGAFSVIQTCDGGYALGGLTYSFGEGLDDFWLVKTDSLGNHLWNQTYGGTSWECAFSVIQTCDGGYALAGGTYSFGVGDSDFWLVKTDSDGNHLWNKTYGEYSLDGAYSVVQTLDGGYAVGGSKKVGGDLDFWLVKTNSTGDMEWNEPYKGAGYDIGYSMIQTRDGGYVMAGRTGAVEAGDQDFWLVKTNSTGKMEWDETYGGTKEDEGRSVVQTLDGGYALTGFIKSFGSGGTDAWIVKTNSTGHMQWNQTYGTSRHEGAYCVIQTRDGGYGLAGYAESEAGDKDMWLIKLAPLFRKTMLFFNINPNPTTPGQTITLKGVLIDECTSRLGDETVELYAKPLGAPSWAYITSLTTDAYGMFQWQITVPWTTPANIYLFTAYYPGSEAYESCYNFDVLVIQ